MSKPNIGSPGVGEPESGAADHGAASGATASAVRLDQLTAQELVDFFGTLEAPTLGEMNGEFPAVGQLAVAPMRNQTLSNIVVGIVATNVFNPLGGTWVGKAFNGGTQGADTGQGYNYFQRKGATFRRLPFLTRVGPSVFDGKPSFQMLYSAFHSVWGDTINLVDEIRRIAPGRYLLLAASGIRHPQTDVPLIVELEGPATPYVADIGRRRKRFDLANPF